MRALGGSNAAKEQAAGALGNLALDQRNKGHIQNAGGFEALQHLVQTGNKGQRTVAEAALTILSHADEVECVVVKG